jgi:hypothetical protein
MHVVVCVKQVPDTTNVRINPETNTLMREGVEAIVNIIVILLLSGIAIKALKDYERQKAEGKDPVFHETNIGLDNTDVWKE